MPEKSQAEIFIETLAEVLQSDRDRRIADLLNRQRMHANRYMTRLAREIGTSGRPSEQAPGSARGAAQQMFDQ